MQSSPALSRVGVSALLLYFVALWFGVGWLQFLTKGIPVFCLALWVGSISAGPYAGLMRMGLFWSVLGDLFLVFSDKPLCFVFGLLSFLVAHLCYCGAFYQRSSSSRLVWAVAAYGFGVLMYRFLYPSLGGMALPVFAYVSVVCTMLWRAFACVGDSGPVRPAETSGVVGALSFALSDSILAFDHFSAPIKHAPYLIIITYWFGQYLLARSARVQ